MSVGGDLKQVGVTTGVGAVILIGVLWYLKSKASSAVGSLGSAVTDAAAALWSPMQTPIFDTSGIDTSTVEGQTLMTLANTGSGTVYAPGNTVNSLALGQIPTVDSTETTNPTSSLSDYLMAGTFGSILNTLTGGAVGQAVNGSTGTDTLDYGTGSNDWND